MQKVETFPKSVAQIYDQIMGYFDYEKSARTIDDIIKNHWYGTAKPDVLEIGIGTGNIASALIELGYNVEGIDHSSAMLARAKEKFPEILLHHADIKDFSLDKLFGVVLSHAGPLRMDYAPERGYFFETYLESKQDVEKALQNVSRHLMQDGIFLMSVQTAPGRERTMSSTPIYEQLEGGYVATKVITDEGNIRIKRRELRKDGRLVASITHRFLVLDLNEFSETALRYNLQDRGLDSTEHFCIYLR